MNSLTWWTADGRGVIIVSEAEPLPIEEADDELAVRAKLDPQAFSLLYRRFAARVYRYAYGRVANATEAEEITSEVFLGALQALEGYRPRGSFAAWLFTIARRRCIDHLRRPTDLPLGDETAEDSDCSPASQAIERESMERLERVLASLSDEERELLRLRYAAELTHRQIGQLLGRSEAAIKMAMLRLLRKTRARWEARDG